MRQVLGLSSLLFLTVALAACNDDDVSRVKPFLAIEDATADATGAADYVLDFGDVRVGRTQRETVTVVNAGAARLTVDAVTATAPFEALLAKRELNANARTPLEFAFTPTGEAAFEQHVTVTSNGGTATIRLVGHGVAVEPCRLVANPSSVDFGSVLMGTSVEKAVVLTNEGGDTCRVTQVAVAAGSATVYTILTSGGARTFEVAPSAWTELLVRFKPTSAGGPQLGTAEVTTDDTSVLRIQLTGNGDEPCPGALPDGTCPVADDPVYVNTSDQLFSYDPTNGVATLVGKFKAGSTTIDAMTDIAIDTTGAMLGVRAKGTGSSRVMELYRINPASAEVSKISNLGGAITGTLNGLTFLADGRLILAGEAVWVINRSTGAVVSTLVAKGTYETSGDIIGLPDGYLYWSVRGGSGGNDRIVRINPNDGSTRVVGTTSKAGIYGLGFGNDTLYGFSSDKTSFAISPDNAATSQTRATDGSWWGATTNPVLW